MLVHGVGGETATLDQNGLVEPCDDVLLQRHRLLLVVFLCHTCVGVYLKFVFYKGVNPCFRFTIASVGSGYCTVMVMGSDLRWLRTDHRALKVAIELSTLPTALFSPTRIQPSESAAVLPEWMSTPS